MADTASNQKKTIATKGTAHVAKTMGPTDDCFDPSDPPSRDCYDNLAPMALLAKGATTRTKIAGQPIWTEIGEVGPGTLPPHPPHTVGVVTGMVYQLEATPTQWSSDVLAEGHGVVRTNDTTNQNRANTVGFVDGSKLGQDPTTEEEFLKKLCTITTLTGQCEHDRALGFPMPGGKGEPYYLEVLSGDTITFTADRFDVTKDPMEPEPKCRKGEHTKWLARSTWRDGAAVLFDLTREGQGKTFTVDGDLTKLSPFDSGFGEVSDDAAVKRKTNRTLVTEEMEVGVSTSTFTSIVQWLAVWKLRQNPPVIKVEATACSGSKTAELKVFPSQGIKASIFAEGETAFTQPFNSFTEKVKKIVDLGVRFARLAGQADIEMKLLNAPKVNLTLEYVECKEEKGRGPVVYTPARVNRKWLVDFGFDPLLGVEVAIGCPILVALPVLGQPAAWLLRQINRYFPTAGVVADLFLEVTCNFCIAGMVGQDEYDFFSATGAVAKVPLELAMGVNFGAAGITGIKAQFTFSVEVSVGLLGGDKPKVLLQAQIEGKIQAGAEIMVMPDTMFEYKPAKWEPEWLGTSFDPPLRFDLLTVS